jgi:hypothetical protein
MKTRSFSIILLIAFSYSIAFSQKAFEGKVTSEIKWENVPVTMKAFIKNSTAVTYYKKDKTRTESAASNYTAVTIEDYTTGKRLMLMDMNAGMVKQKTATITNILIPDLENVNVEKTQEFKELAGYNCEKIITTTVVNGKVNKTFSFVYNDLVVNSLLLPSGPTYSGLTMETSIETGTGTMKIVVQQVTEEAVSDDRFNFEIPSGYKVTDLSKKNQVTPNIVTTSTTSASSSETKSISPSPVKKYTNVSDAELQKLLDEAVKKEDFDTAQAVKTEMDIRKKISTGKYGNYSVTELTKMLNEAVGKEDYTAAQEIKKELDGRKK